MNKTSKAEAYGVFAADSWSPMGFYIGSTLTLPEAQEMVKKSKYVHPDRFTHEIHACRLGWYERKFDSLVERIH